MRRIIWTFSKRRANLSYQAISDMAAWRAQVKLYSGPVLLYLTSNASRHCPQLKKALKKNLSDIENLKFCQIYADNSQELAMSLGLKVIPTIFLIDRGRALTRFEGNMPQGQRTIFEMGVRAKLEKGELQDKQADFLFYQIFEHINKEEFNYAWDKISKLKSSEKFVAYAQILSLKAMLKQARIIDYLKNIKRVKRMVKQPSAQQLLATVELDYNNCMIAAIHKCYPTLETLKHQPSKEALKTAVQALVHQSAYEQARKIIIQGMRFYDLKQLQFQKLMEIINKDNWCDGLIKRFNRLDKKTDQRTFQDFFK